MDCRQVVVVGGGVAGCSAAIEAARLGLSVTIVDEHPQSLATLSLDAPYFYGAGLSNVLSNRSLMADSVLGSNNLLMACVEEGVDVLTSTCVWGSYRPGPNSTSLTTGQLGLADETRSWMLEYDHLILAPGARDLVLPFPNWQLAGVLGACGATALLDRYQAFGQERLVILGSGNLALRTAQAALRHGVKVEAIVEVGSEIQGNAALATDLQAAGIRIALSHTVLNAVGKMEVEGVRIAEVGEDLAHLAGTEKLIPCDSICMAFGAVPNIELAAVTGCDIVFDAAFGGWVPVIDCDMQSSEKNVFVVGDGAGVTEAMMLDHAIASNQGRRAAQIIAGRADAAQDAAAPAQQHASTGTYPPHLWHRALVAAGGPDVMVCQCEEVTRREVLDVSPPRYLNSTIRTMAGGLSGLSASGRTSQDLVKRLTRAGMGYCQGRRCRDHTAMLLTDAALCDLSAITPGSYRAPVRPLPLKILSADDESEDMRNNWRTWVHAADGIPEA